MAAALLVSAIGLVSLAASAGTEKGQKDFTIGKKGEIHFNVPVKAGRQAVQVRGCTSSNTSLTAMITW